MCVLYVLSTTLQHVWTCSTRDFLIKLAILSLTASCKQDCVDASLRWTRKQRSCWTFKYFIRRCLTRLHNRNNSQHLHHNRLKSWPEQRVTWVGFYRLSYQIYKMKISLLGYHAVQYRCRQTFHRCTASHHQGDSWQYAHLKRRSTPTRLYGAISQKTIIFILDTITWNLKYRGWFIS
jgi:hypothetical protein